MEIKNNSKSTFLDVMGNYPTNRILNFLIVFNKFDYSKKDIARNSHVSYATLKYLWPNFEEKKIVKQTRRIGKAKLYKLNQENKIVKQLVRTYKTITLSFVKEDKIKVSIN